MVVDRYPQCAAEAEADRWSGSVDQEVDLVDGASVCHRPLIFVAAHAQTEVEVAAADKTAIAVQTRRALRMRAGCFAQEGRTVVRSPCRSAYLRRGRAVSEADSTFGRVVDRSRTTVAL